MRRVTLVVGVAVVTATMMALAVGSALAKDTQPKPETYIDTVVAKQYFAAPGIGMFRGLATDVPTDGDPGLSGELDTRITYTGGPPGPGVENTVTGGAWMLCSKFTADPLTLPECTTGSAESGIALEGTVSKGTAEWDTTGTYATLPNGRQVYAGVAKVKAIFTVEGGTVNGVPVTGGSGKFKGTLDHTPLPEPPILTGILELKF